MKYLYTILLIEVSRVPMYLADISQEKYSIRYNNFHCSEEDATWNRTLSETCRFTVQKLFTKRLAFIF